LPKNVSHGDRDLRGKNPEELAEKVKREMKGHTPDQFADLLRKHAAGAGLSLTQAQADDLVNNVKKAAQTGDLDSCLRQVAQQFGIKYDEAQIKMLVKLLAHR
jgi:anthranilate phosphoribosyltransferase